MVIAHASFFEIAGVIAWAERTMKAGISANVDSAKPRLRGGEFYEVQGDLKLESSPDDWVLLGPEPHAPAKHFLFYLRDETFECDAEAVESLTVLPVR
jgi:hypothetical protein